MSKLTIFLNFFKEKYRKTKKYINMYTFNKYIWVKQSFKDIQLTYQLKRLLILAFETFITGWLIHYSITNFNPMSLGVLSFLMTYYIEWFVKLIKRKEEN